MDKILAPFEELLDSAQKPLINENSLTVDKLDECFDNNCVNGVFLCYACIIEYLDNDKEDFAFYMKKKTLQNVSLDEFYFYRSEEERESIRTNFRSTFLSLIPSY